ncbi:HutD family protein [Neorhizobium galegae]|uniref:HutD/Ves family protein n=2 Tax=Neorhizobium galegae TaxID=399 RepID=UPI0006227752|nr:HutD family protein [Neorhizobium galegae]CDZ42175.1 HutD family protein [Neorhizobium galegae bv. officinalis]KAA9383354.1 HutD family protein [Neorhizobium galegae]KAB1111520.1 HutD family protein [Neorhizobium galegae]MCM2500302.1 HutD family protein [Neorhizobium galegae]MCQ1768629.1 HutD family protein [Neorhizobium galegae]
MKILRASDYKRMPWKNGGGETVEIAVHPAGTSIEDFDWRISMASVASDGPFSSFPDVDRTLAILSGDGIDLTVDGDTSVTLTRSSEPYPFAADRPVFATLVNGVTTDLNVMTRRGRFSHRVIRQPTPVSLRPSAFLRFVLATGKHTIALSSEKFELGPLDCLSVGAEVTGDLAISGDSEVFLIELHPEAGHGLH